MLFSYIDLYLTLYTYSRHRANIFSDYCIYANNPSHTLVFQFLTFFFLSLPIFSPLHSSCPLYDYIIDHTVANDFIISKIFFECHTLNHFLLFSSSWLYSPCALKFVSHETSNTFTQMMNHYRQIFSSFHFRFSLHSLGLLVPHCHYKSLKMPSFFSNPFFWVSSL